MDIPDEFAPSAWEVAVERPDAHLLGFDPSGTWCGLFVLEHHTARLVAERAADDGEDRGRLDELRALPVRQAVCYRYGSYVWAIDARGCSVWSRLFSIVLDERGDTLLLPGRELAKRDVVAVQAFTDDVDPRRAGVELVLADGTCTETMLSVRDGDDGAWARDLAARLAERWHVPYRHVVPGGYKDAWLRAQAASAAQTRALIDGLVDAAVRYDDPDRVVAREQREALRERRDAQILRHSYIVSGQQRIAAWDRDAPDTVTIVVADRTTNELLMRVVERRTAGAGERDAAIAEQRRAGDAIGATYRRSLVYWVIDDTLCSVFRRRGEVTALARVDDELQIGERRVPVASVRAVVAFSVPERTGHRGLALELVDGSHVLIEEDEDAQYDRGPGGKLRAGWSEALAPELAAALGVPARIVHADVLVRPPAPRDPATRVLAACGAPVLAHTLSAPERERARREGRVVHIFDWGWRSMGDSEAHAAFAVVNRETGDVADGDLVFAAAVPADIEGSWSSWETPGDVYRAFDIEPPRVS